MANSKYEYVKSFEVEDEIMLPNIIVVRVDGCDFRSFILKKETKFYQRRASKIHSLIVSLFTSVYVTKWKTLFPQKDLKYAPSFRSRIICCASAEILQAYLLWRQYDCMITCSIDVTNLYDKSPDLAMYIRLHFVDIIEVLFIIWFAETLNGLPFVRRLKLIILIFLAGHLNNQYDTCFWELINSGKTEKVVEELLKGSLKQDKNELLYQCFNINYRNDIPEIFRQGTCTLKTEVVDIVKYKDDGCPVKRLRKKVIMVHSENIASTRFWRKQLSFSKELGQFTEDIYKTRHEYVKSFLHESKLLPYTWIIIRIDGCHFHRFTEVHEFEKPNDAEALNLMNSCAAAVLEEFKDIVFAYGVSDEYSFVVKKDSQLYQRHASKIVSAVVSFFSSMYTMRWNDFFPHKEMKYPTYFDGRAVCYPSREILIDYLAWRQVDCHINNQYNTCFWMLVKSGKSKSDAQNYLKGTQAPEKSDLLDQLSRMDNYYSRLPPMFRLGSSVYWDTEMKMLEDEQGGAGKSRKIVVVKHCNIIESSFWKAHPEILDHKCNNGFTTPSVV